MFPAPTLWCCSGWRWVGLGHVRLAVAGAALGVHPLWHGVSD